MPIDRLLEDSQNLGDPDSQIAEGEAGGGAGDPASSASGIAPPSAAEASASGTVMPAATGSPTSPPAQTAASIREALSARGYDASRFQSEEEALDGLLATAEAFHQAQPLIQTGRRYVSQADKIDAWLAEQEKAAQETEKAAQSAAKAPAQAAKPVFEWKPPEYDPAWEARSKWDAEAGRYVPATQYDNPAIADKLNAFGDWQRQAGRDILLRFPELVEQAMSGRLEATEKLIDQRVQEVVAAKLTEYQSQQTTQSYFSEREKELFEFDAATGRKKIDPTTGQESLTAKGKAFVEYAQQGREFGITDPQKLIAYTERELRRDEQAGRFGAAGGGNGNPAQTPAEKKGEFLKQAMRGGNLAQRSGTFPVTTAPDDTLQNPDATLDEIFNDELQKRGLLPQTG